MFAEREEGFAQPEEIGLFTFYREQQEVVSPQQEVVPPQQAGLAFGISHRLPALTSTRGRPPSHDPPRSPRLQIQQSEHRRASPSPPGVLHRMPKLTLPPSLTALRPEPTSIIHLTFAEQTPRREKLRLFPKTRARTEASAESPFAHSTPLKEPTRRHNFPKKEQSFEYLSAPFKFKAVVLRLGSSKKVGHQGEEQEGPAGQWSSAKPAGRPEGLSINFWEHFQERKNLLLDRYKRERAGRGKCERRRPCPVLTNNHI